MATQSRHSGASPFIGDTLSPDGVRKEFIEAPLEAAKQSAIGTGLDLFAFMTALPDVFLMSEQRELKRLSRSAGKKNDPRIDRLKASIERGKEWHTHTRQGKTRIERLLVSLSEEDNVFHGFVSDVELQPREKVTVRISADRDGEKSGKFLLATTDADGYFSISLGKDSKVGSKKPMAESTVNLSERMNELLMRVNAKAGTGSSDTKSASASNDQEVLARVEILDAAGNVLHQDASPLVVNAGTAYREYLLGGKGSIESNDPRKSSKTESKNTADATDTASPAAAVRKTASPGKKSIDKKTKK